MQASLPGLWCPPFPACCVCVRSSVCRMGSLQCQWYSLCVLLGVLYSYSLQSICCRPGLRVCRPRWAATHECALHGVQHVVVCPFFSVCAPNVLAARAWFVLQAFRSTCPAGLFLHVRHSSPTGTPSVPTQICSLSCCSCCSPFGDPLV